MTRALPALAVLLFLALAAPAPAATCNFAGETMTATNASVFKFKRVGNNVEVRTSGDALVPCGSPNVATVDTIDVTTSGGNSGSVTIDLSGGEFAPGDSAEEFYTPEIEFDVSMSTSSDQVQVVGGADDDHIRVGSGGINLRSNEGRGVDVDVSMGGVDLVILLGRAGDDELSLGGGAETSGESSIKSIVAGGEGDDSLRGGANVDSIGNALEIESGNNTFTGSGGNDTLVSGPGNDTFEGGTGSDTASFSSPTGVNVDLTITGEQATGHGLDSLAGIENLGGSNGDDVLRGDAGSNSLSGGEGDDYFQPRAGEDTISAGTPIMPTFTGGVDTVDYSDAPAGVKVDLELSTQNTGGSGTETLFYIENVIGSSFADELRGTSAANTIDGGGGVDLIDSRQGADSLFVRDLGLDNVTCGPDADSVIADDPGVDQLAADCETVAFGDSIPPETTIDDGPSGDIDDATPTFEFSANEAGSTFECSVDGAAYAPCTSPVEIGPLAPGEHTFEVRAKDAFGNTDPTPATRTVELPDGSGGAGGGGTGGAGGEADGRVPVLRKVVVTRKRFRVGRRPTALSAARAGTAFRYRLSETAVVSIAIQKCKRKRPRRCRTVGTLVRSAKKGRNRTGFSGRLADEKLAPGRYRALVMAVDPAGNRSKKKRVGFRIVAK